MGTLLNIAITFHYDSLYNLYDSLYNLTLFLYVPLTLVFIQLIVESRHLILRSKNSTTESVGFLNDPLRGVSLKLITFKMIIQAY